VRAAFCEIDAPYGKSHLQDGLGYLQSGAVDMLAADYNPSTERMPYFEFSHPFGVSSVTMIVSGAPICIKRGKFKQPNHRHYN